MTTVSAPDRDVLEKPESEFTIRRASRLGESVAMVLVIAVLAVVLISVATNERFGWDVVGDYLFAPQILLGLGSTLLLTLGATLIGLVLGTVIAVMRMSTVPVLAAPAWLFALFFRGTPLLVQLIFWYNFAALYPVLGITLPGIGTLFEADVNAMISPLTAGLLALGLNEGAYMSEIIRGGIIGVDRGQTEAARAIGMRPGRILRRIVMPQAMRTIIPPMGNEIIGLLKATSLVSVIAVADLLFSAQIIYSQNLQIIPLLIVASIWYMVVTSIMSVGQFYLERHFGRGATRDTAPKLHEVLLSSFTRFHAPTPKTPVRKG